MASPRTTRLAPGAIDLRARDRAIPSDAGEALTAEIVLHQRLGDLCERRIADQP